MSDYIKYIYYFESFLLTLITCIVILVLFDLYIFKYDEPYLLEDFINSLNFSIIGLILSIALFCLFVANCVKLADNSLSIDHKLLYLSINATLRLLSTLSIILLVNELFMLFSFVFTSKIMAEFVVFLLWIIAYIVKFKIKVKINTFKLDNIIFLVNYIMAIILVFVDIRYIPFTGLYLLLIFYRIFVIKSDKYDTIDVFQD